MKNLRHGAKNEVIRYNPDVYRYKVIKKEKISKNLYRFYVESKENIYSGHQIEYKSKMFYIFERYDRKIKNQLIQILEASPIKETQIDIKIFIKDGLTEKEMKELKKKINYILNNTKIEKWNIWQDSNVWKKD